MKAIFGKSAKSATPISSHPLFPGIVALWFAALFGFGSLVLPTILIERAIDAVGLPSLIGATAPPLGLTAKLMIAASAAVFGAAIGFFVARKVSSANAVEKPRKRGLGSNSENDRKKPIYASEELGGDTIDSPMEHTVNNSGARRRELTLSDEGPERSEWLENAPLPGGVEDTLVLQNLEESEAGTANVADTAPIHYSAEIEQAKADDEIRFAPQPDEQPSTAGFESKQVFQPQAAAPMQELQESLGEAQSFANSSTGSSDHHPARELPNIKIEPDPEPSELENADQFDFKPLDQSSGEEIPVNPELEARLSNLTSENTETPPSNMLVSGVEQHGEPAATAQVNAAPLSFSPPSLSKKQFAQPDEMTVESKAPQPVAEPIKPELDESVPTAGQVAEDQKFVAEETRPFDSPASFGESTPIEATQVEHIEQLQQELAAIEANKEIGQAEMDSAAHADSDDDSELELSVAQAEERPEAETESGGSEEDFDFMKDPITGKSLDTLGTVELIERLAKSVRLRAEQAPEAPSKPTLPEAMEAFAEEAPTVAEVPEQTVAAESPVGSNPPAEAADHVEAAQDDAPAPQFAPPSASPNVGVEAVPAALQPIELELVDEMDEDESFSLPTAISPVEADQDAPFAAPKPTAEVAQIPAAPQLSPIADPAQVAKQESPVPQSFEVPQEPKMSVAMDPESEPEATPQVHAQVDGEEVPFGSLLELRNRLTQPQEFVRVNDEPVAEDSAEPAVIFPGQGGQPAPQPSEYQPEEVASAPQSFDPAPEQVEEGQPATFAPAGFTRRPEASDAAQMPEPIAPAQPKAPVAKDPAETERALRSALATLQRMSGAA